MKWFCCAALSFVGACTGHVGGKGSVWSVEAQPLALSPSSWNATNADFGTIAAIAEDGDDVLVFSDHGATLLAGGAAAASDDSITNWQTAGRIPAADGSGYWAIGIDGDGKMYRLRAQTELEVISDRYGLLDDAVHSVAALASPYVAFSLGARVAIADGDEVTRYDLPSDRMISGDAHQLAAVAMDGSFRVLDIDKHQARTLPITAAIRGGFVSGELLVQTADALYIESGTDLIAVHHAEA
ncbi:MAG TPA: hypothetical protein VHZ95_06355, partial [Polyangiales bacterium]|nr:hypothetical protein [Polyangiales bacterium]